MTADCGTTAGVSRHRRNGEIPCEACKRAERDRVRARRPAPECGTNAAYQRHYRYGETCQVCRDAHAERSRSVRRATTNGNTARRCIVTDCHEPQKPRTRRGYCAAHADTPRPARPRDPDLYWQTRSLSILDAVAEVPRHRRVDPDTARRAALTCARHADTADELRQLLDMVGLLPLEVPR